jgi:Holliday junction resolvase RusA-like endonuclease
VITNIAFTVPGEPQGKGRARVGKIGGHARMFTPARTVAYEGLIAMAAQQAMAGARPLPDACAIEVECVFAMPKSMSKKHRVEALAGRIRPTKKPDGDNVLKAVCDGINGVVWDDDVQAVDSRVVKRYGETPAVHVRVAALIPAAAPLEAA